MNKQSPLGLQCNGIIVIFPRVNHTCTLLHHDPACTFMSALDKFPLFPNTILHYVCIIGTSTYICQWPIIFYPSKLLSSFWANPISHIDLCVIEYSLVDAPTALKHGYEACLHIWHLTWNLYIVSPNLSCELLTDKMYLLIKNIQQYNSWQSDFAWEFFFIIWQNKLKLQP